MSLLQMSFSGAMLIAAMVVARALAINKLPKKTFLALGGIALIRLLLPFSMPSMFSAYSVIEHSVPAMETVRQTPVANIFPVAPDRGMTTITNAAGPVETGTSVWAVIWAGGTVACFLFFAISYIRCLREFQTSLPIQNDFAKDWIATHQIRGQIAIRQSNRISAPLTGKKEFSGIPNSPLGRLQIINPPGEDPLLAQKQKLNSITTEKGKNIKMHTLWVFTLFHPEVLRQETDTWSSS